VTPYGHPFPQAGIVAMAALGYGSPWLWRAVTIQSSPVCRMSPIEVLTRRLTQDHLLQPWWHTVDVTVLHHQAS